MTKSHEPSSTDIQRKMHADIAGSKSNTGLPAQTSLRGLLAHGLKNVDP